MPDRLAGDNMVKRLLDLHLVMRVSKTEKSKVIEMMDEQTYSPDGYFIWLYQGSAWRGILIGTGKSYAASYINLITSIFSHIRTWFKTWDKYIRLSSANLQFKHIESTHF